MKIAIVVNELNIRGGTHKQVLRLCQYLKHQNIEFVLATKIYEKEKTYPEFSEFNVISLYGDDDKILKRRNHKGRFFNLAGEDQLLYQMISNDVDIINVHDNGLYKLQYLAKHDGKKVVWQINDLPAVFRVGNTKMIKKSLKTEIKKIIIKHWIRNTDAITVNVTKNQKRVKELLHRESEVFYCGVDVNNNLTTHTFEEFKEFKLLSMGVFFEYRNYETLVLVVKELLSQGKSIHLDIIGNTKLDVMYAEKISDLIKKNNLDNHIKIWGEVDELTYAQLFNQASAFAFVNIDQSWGLAVFEAMSCGLPTIVSNSVGATELLHNEIDSIVVEPTNVKEICDKLKKLMENQDYYDFISCNGENVVKNYTWDEMYSSKMAELFKKLEGKQ